MMDAVRARSYVVDGVPRLRKPKVASAKRDPALRTTCQCAFQRRAVDVGKSGATVLAVRSTVSRPDKNVTIVSERFVEASDEGGAPRLHELLSVRASGEPLADAVTIHRTFMRPRVAPTSEARGAVEAELRAVVNDPKWGRDEP